MDWPAATPYAIATLAFTQWPALWLVVVVVAACSVHRVRAALTCGVAMTLFLLLMLDLGIARPHLDHANYGHVIFAAAVLAPLLMLPRPLWPAPDPAASPDPPSESRQGARRLLALIPLFALVYAIDLGLDALDPEPTDARLAGYMVYTLLPTMLAARWTATGVWLVAAPVLVRRPRIRRAVAAVAVMSLLMWLHDARTLPRMLVVAGDFAGMGLSQQEPEASCATVTAHENIGVLHLDGVLCSQTPAAFDAVRARHPQIKRIVLDSSGGRVVAGLAIGRRLQESGFEARVDGHCTSACVTVFIGARRRYVGPDGWVAVHQSSAHVWAEGGETVRWPFPPDEEVLAFQRLQGISPEIAARADATEPERLDVLSNEDLVAYGIAEPTTDAPWLPADALPEPSATTDGDPQ